MTKIYEIMMMRSSIELKVGENYKRIKFDGGMIFGNHRMPATYITSDIDVQNAIEGLPAFERGEISIRPSEEQEDKHEDKVDVEHTFLDVSNTQKAKNIISKFGIELTTEASTADVVSKGKELGLIFPNWITYNK